MKVFRNRKSTGDSRFFEPTRGKEFTRSVGESAGLSLY